MLGNTPDWEGKEGEEGGKGMMEEPLNQLSLNAAGCGVAVDRSAEDSIEERVRVTARTTRTIMHRIHALTIHFERFLHCPPPPLRRGVVPPPPLPVGRLSPRLFSPSASLAVVIRRQEGMHIPPAAPRRDRYQLTACRGGWER